MTDAETILETEQCTLREITTREQAIRYGRRSGWCTSDEANEMAFASYTRGRRMVIVSRRGDETRGARYCLLIPTERVEGRRHQIAVWRKAERTSVTAGELALEQPELAPWLHEEDRAVRAIPAIEEAPTQRQRPIDIAELAIQIDTRGMQRLAYQAEEMERALRRLQDIVADPVLQRAPSRDLQVDRPTDGDVDRGVSGRRYATGLALIALAVPVAVGSLALGLGSLPSWFVLGLGGFLSTVPRRSEA